MSMQKSEYPHNSREQVLGYLDDALSVVAELDPPAWARELVLEKAIDLLAAKQVVLEQVGLGLGLAGVQRG